MSTDIEARLDLLDQMITSLGKVINARLRLKAAGEAQLAAQMNAKSEELLEQIDMLQDRVLVEWTVSAAELTGKLQKANNSVQSRIRNIRKQINVADNAIKIIGQIDDALLFLKKLVA